MSFVEILKVITVGIVEGFTEWLPVSSTGHLLLLDELISLNVSPEFKDLFLTVIQMGTMAAVIMLFFRRLNPFSGRKRPEQKKATWLLWSKIILSCIPAALIGVLVEDFIEEKMHSPFVIAAMLILYGALFIIIENRIRYKQPRITRLGQIDYQLALYLGLIQILALIPGTSRSGTTILGAILLGFARPVAVEFSFFMGIPVIAGAGLLKIVKYEGAFTGTEIAYLIIGTLAAFLVSLYAVRFIIGWIRKNDFKLFGYYRIALGIIVFLWFAVSGLVN